MTDTDTMTPSQAALDLLHEFEQGPQGGMASVPYKDFAGHWTIGWGHRILPRERFSNPITASQADDLLRSDLERFAAGVNSWVTAPITNRCSMLWFASPSTSGWALSKALPSFAY